MGEEKKMETEEEKDREGGRKRDLLQTVQARAKAGKGSQARIRSCKSSGSVPHRISSMGVTMEDSVSVCMVPPIATPPVSSPSFSSMDR